MELPPLLADLSEFVALHRPHGELRAIASPPTPNGYRLEVACTCRVVFVELMTASPGALREIATGQAGTSTTSGSAAVTMGTVRARASSNCSI